MATTGNWIWENIDKSKDVRIIDGVQSSRHNWVAKRSRISDDELPTQLYEEANSISAYAGETERT